MKNMKIKGAGSGAGFTLIELLLVIGILVILISATIVAINPFRQFAQANNASRLSGVTTIMNAVYQNVVDNAGLFDSAGAGEIPSTKTNMGSAEAEGDYDICRALVGDSVAIPPIVSYLSILPVDPQKPGEFKSCDDYNTGYEISRDSTTGRIEICAPVAQLGEVICLTR